MEFSELPDAIQYCLPFVDWTAVAFIVVTDIRC